MAELIGLLLALPMSLLSVQWPRSPQFSVIIIRHSDLRRMGVHNAIQVPPVRKFAMCNFSRGRFVKSVVNFPHAELSRRGALRFLRAGLLGQV